MDNVSPVSIYIQQGPATNPPSPSKSTPDHTKEVLIYKDLNIPHLKTSAPQIILTNCKVGQVSFIDANGKLFRGTITMEENSSIKNMEATLNNSTIVWYVRRSKTGDGSQNNSSLSHQTESETTKIERFGATEIYTGGTLDFIQTTAKTIYLNCNVLGAVTSVNKSKKTPKIDIWMGDNAKIGDEKTTEKTGKIIYYEDSYE